MIATSGLLLLCMSGVQLAVTAGRDAGRGQRYRYDHRTQTLYLDAGLTVQEVLHICDAVLETVISRALVDLLRPLGPTPAA